MTETSKPGCGRSLAVVPSPGLALSEMTGSADHQYFDIAATYASSTLIGGRRDLAAKASGTNDPYRTPDRLAAALAFAFIVLLLATESVLTLRDEGPTTQPLYRASASGSAV
jgi:hypothetical protein